MGIIHGMAGSAALILLFVGQVDSISTGLAYITIFGLGSILGMFVFSLVISVPLGMTAKKLTRVHTGLQFSIGVVTSALGVGLLVAPV